MKVEFLGADVGDSYSLQVVPPEGFATLDHNNKKS